MYQLVFYVPETHVESVKQAVFNAGGGRTGDYDRCCWQTLGQGQFRPLAGSSPFLGKVGSVEKVDEYRVELVISASCKSAVVAALIESHPYEEPAYSLWKLENPSLRHYTCGD